MKLILIASAILFALVGTGTFAAASPGGTCAGLVDAECTGYDCAPDGRCGTANCLVYVSTTSNLDPLLEPCYVF